MKLLCINNKPLPNCCNMPEALSLIKELNEYEGEMSLAMNPDGTWESAWFISSLERHYDTSRFVPLSDEPEIVHEEELVFAL